MSAFFESLETRQMMSASLKSGVLRVAGTDGNDNIVVTVEAGRLVVTTNGVVDGRFVRSGVKRMAIDTFDGDDSVNVASAVTAPALIKTGDGDDLVNAGSGGDTILGGDGDDVIRSRKGDDRIDPGTGFDLLDGGAGLDTIDFSSSSTAMEIGLNGYAKIRTTQLRVTSFHRIENADGSQGDDNITGNAATTLIRGNGGHDRLEAFGAPTTLSGGAGDDVLVDAIDWRNLLDGGTGNDTADYSEHQSNPVTVSLDNLANDGEAGENDLVRAAENIRGGFRDDTLVGNDAANVIDGYYGNDTVSGLGANDKLLGGWGQDNLDGGAGNDTVNGGEDDDMLTGGAGSDALLGDAGADSLFANDGERDALDGGADTDFARVDPPLTGVIDSTTSVENVRSNAL